MNTSSPSSFPFLIESESPVPGDFFAVSSDYTSGLRMNKKGNGYFSTELSNEIRGRFDFAAPGLATLVWGVAKATHVPWVIKQIELPPGIVASAALPRLFLLWAPPLPVNLCAFSPSVIKEADAWRVLDAVPEVMFFALRKTTLVNPRFENVVSRWQVA